MFNERDLNCDRWSFPFRKFSKGILEGNQPRNFQDLSVAEIVPITFNDKAIKLQSN